MCKKTSFLEFSYAQIACILPNKNEYLFIITDEENCVRSCDLGVTGRFVSTARAREVDHRRRRLGVRPVGSRKARLITCPVVVCVETKARLRCRLSLPWNDLQHDQG